MEVYAKSDVFSSVLDIPKSPNLTYYIISILQFLRYIEKYFALWCLCGVSFINEDNSKLQTIGLARQESIIMHKWNTEL